MEKLQERVEKAICDMKKIDHATRELYPDPEIEGCFEIAMELLDMPKDNTMEYDLNDTVVREYVEENNLLFCWDWFLDMWYNETVSGEKFIQECQKELLKN